MKLFVLLYLTISAVLIRSHLIQHDTKSISMDEALDSIEALVKKIGGDSEKEGNAVGSGHRFRRDVENRGVTNLDIRDAILQLLNVVRDGNKNVEKHEMRAKELSEEILEKVKAGGGSGGATDKKIDNISTFLLRMNAKLDAIEKKFRRGGGGGGSEDLLQTLAQESFDILALLPTYIENTKDAVTVLSKETEKRFENMEHILIGNGTGANGKTSVAQMLKASETKILGASTELKEIVTESGQMAESLFERVNDGYHDLTQEIKGLSNVEQVLLDTADSVMDTKRKVEFGVQQIIFKVGELVKLSGGEIDVQLKDQFADITRTILSNQTEALGNLTKKVEKEIGQVWRQMGIMYGQVSNSIAILEKVRDATEGYVNHTGKNLGTMEGQVEGLTDRMVDVDSNLNYMLGQLSLVVREFNQVKTGLGEAMSGLSEELNEIKEYTPPTEATKEPGS